MIENKKPEGMRAFVTLWLGQVVSIFGTRLTNFALGIWVLERTGSVTNFSLLLLFITLPAIAVSMVSGALVDRWDRRRAMLLADTGSGFCTLSLALLLYFDRLPIWFVVVALALNTVFSTLQMPAYAASIPLLVPKEHFGRANGMVEFGNAFAQVFAPALAGLMVKLIQVHGVLALDFMTYLVALGTLFAVRIPRPEKAAEAAVGESPSLLREAADGWAYVSSRGGLLGLLLLFAGFNFVSAMTDVLLAPMLLRFATVALVGTVVTVFGAGLVVGSVGMSAWGGPKRRVQGIFAFALLQALALMFAGLRPVPALIAGAMFVWALCSPVVSGTELAVWQRKTRPDLQGRVFALRTAVAYSTLPLAYVLAGPLADKVFEPALAPGGPLAGSVGRILGVGPGRGMGLMLVLLGLLTVATVLVGMLSRPLRNLETDLPDALPDEPEIHAAPEIAALPQPAVVEEVEARA